MPRLAALLFALAAAPGCTGGAVRTVPDPTGAHVAAAGACVAPSPGPSPVRRLTRREYDATVRDLLGDTSAPAAHFVAEEQGLGFDNEAERLGVSTVLVEQQMVAAEELAARAVRDLRRLLACDPARVAPEPCVRAFIARFGKRAWRRPLSHEEQASLFQAYARGRGWGDVSAGVRTVIAVLLQAPDFLFRIEAGQADAGRVARLTAYETASRLSYLLWGTMPDDRLFAAADADRLSTPAEIASEARRMLQDPRARAVVAAFHHQWLALGDIRKVEKDAKRFPAFSSALRPLLEKESAAFVEHVFWNADGRLATLLTASYTFLDERLATFYGVAAPSGEAFTRVELDPTQRAGILTRGGFLAAHAKANQTSPIHRGIFVRRQLLCGSPPPPKVAFEPPDLDATLTTRERFEDHTADVGCAGCHRLFDPIGLAFESYDAVGHFRTTENGKPVDVSGEIVDADVAGPFTGAVELGRKLAHSRDAHRCVVTQWFRYAYGRQETDADRCSLAALARRFAAGGYDMRELLFALTQTDAFLYLSREGRP